MNRALWCLCDFGLMLHAQPQVPRDPFVWPSKKSNSHSKKGITLEGIVYSGAQRSAAVLSCGSLRAMVERGGSFAGYKLLRIGKKFVELARGKEKKKIFID